MPSISLFLSLHFVSFLSFSSFLLCCTFVEIYFTYYRIHSFQAHFTGFESIHRVMPPSPQSILAPFHDPKETLEPLAINLPIPAFPTRPRMYFLSLWTWLFWAFQKSHGLPCLAASLGMCRGAAFCIFCLLPCCSVLSFPPVPHSVRVQGPISLSPSARASWRLLVAHGPGVGVRV